MPTSARPSLPASLICLLLSGNAAVLAQPGPTPTATEADEVRRLQSMLREHYASQAKQDSEIAAGAAKTREQAVVELPGEDYAPQQVVLSGTQGILALEHISRRLTDESIADERRPADIISHSEVRADGSLLLSRSFSLKPLGKSQYASRISLPGGEVEITVRENRWKIALPVSEATDYLVTLNALSEQQLELHVIPVPELQATNWTDFPSWLTSLGVTPGAAPGS